MNGVRGPRRLVNGLAVLDRSPEPDERVEAVLGALRVLEALGTCGESWQIGVSGRVVQVMIRCESPSCVVCGGVNRG